MYWITSSELEPFCVVVAVWYFYVMNAKLAECKNTLALCLACRNIDTSRLIMFRLILCSHSLLVFKFFGND